MVNEVEGRKRRYCEDIQFYFHHTEPLKGEWAID
jgi:hypothetical protein